MMNKHFKLILAMCDNAVVISKSAIYYEEEGFSYVEINGEVFSCYDLQNARELVEMFGEMDLSE